MSDRSGTESIARYVNLLELEGMARRVLPQDIFDFYAGGAGDELTLQAARDAYLGWRLLPHVLAGVGDIDLTTELLGDRLDWPVFIAPTGAHRLAHDAGELATASAARAENTLMVASMYSTVPLEAIAEVAGQRWFNGYLLRDRGLARALKSCRRSRRVLACASSPRTTAGRSSLSSRSRSVETADGGRRASSTPRPECSAVPCG